MSVWIALLCVIVILWLIWRKQHISTFEKLGIPGPKPNLLFGNLLELYEKGPIKCHEEWVKKYGRVLGYYYGMTPALLVTDPQLLKKIFIKDFPKFINREPFNPLSKYSPKEKEVQSILMLPGQPWKEVRSVLTPTFTTAKMKQMASSMNSSIEIMLGIIRERAEANKEFDILDTYQRLTMDVITRTAFGVRTDVQKNFKSKLLRAVQVLFRSRYKDPIIFLGLTVPFLRRLCLKLQDLVLGILNKGTKPAKMLRNNLIQVLQHRRNNPQVTKSDLLQLMIDTKIVTEKKDIDITRLEAGDAENEEKADKEENLNKNIRYMSDDEIISSAFIVLLAGYETTSTALSFTTYLLAKYPEIQEKAFEEIDNLIKSGHDLEYATVNKLPYLDKVLNESMRIYPPVYLFTNRYAVEDVQYNELRIPKGMLIQAPVYLMHHDSEFWSDPEVFDPERFNKKPNSDGITYLPFGIGPRNCLGMRFAQLEAKLALAHIIYNFRIHLSDKQKDYFRTSLRIRTITPKNGVLVRMERRELETSI